jgi:hypothetical protein
MRRDVVVIAESQKREQLKEKSDELQNKNLAISGLLSVFML